MIPVVVIGAGRSGTNILRDILSASPRAATWPCDEINYAWRYGNRSFPTDELTRTHVRPKTRRYMRRLFESLAEETGAEFIVEKTCANSLRVEYVAEILPEARFVFIQRDPIDVVASAMRRWRGELDLGYVADKVRYVPKPDLPYYAARYVRHRLHKLLSREGTLPTWGPRFEGIDELASEEPLHVVCAAQWHACHAKASQSLDDLSKTTGITRVQYESLAREPADVITDVTRHVYGFTDAASVRYAAHHVSADSIGRGAAQLSAQEITDVERFLATVSA